MMRTKRLLVLCGMGVAVSALASCGAKPSGGARSADDADEGTPAGATDEGEGSGVAAADLPELPLPDAGAQLEEKRAMGAKVTFELKQPDGNVAGISDKGWSFAEDRRVRIEQVGDRAVTKVSILYGKREAKGLDSWTSLPTEGQGYEVSEDQGVLFAGKKAASDEENEIVMAEYGYMGKPNPLAVAIYRAKDTGEAQTLSPAAHRLLIGHIPEIKTKAVTLEHVETNGALSNIKVNFVGSIPDGELSYEFDLSGQAQVDTPTGWVRQMDLAGEVRATGTITAKGKKLKADGKGEMTFGRSGTIG